MTKKLILQAVCVVAGAGLWLGPVAPSSAQTFPAPCAGTTGDVATLIQDLGLANANSGPDTIQLQAGCTYTLTSVNNYWYGPNGLPAIADDTTIEGNGATITRSSSAPAFRLFFVGADPNNASTLGYISPGAGKLTLHSVTLTGGLAKGGDAVGGGGGGGAGMGGAIFSQGTVVIDQSTLTGNTARGGGVQGNAFGSGGGIGESSGGLGGGGFGPGTFCSTGCNGGTGSTGGGGGGAGFASGEVGRSADATNPGSGGGFETGLGGFGGDGAASGDGSGGGGGGLNYTNTGGSGGAFGAGGVNGGGGGGIGGGGGELGLENVSSSPHRLVRGGGGGFGGGGGGSWGADNSVGGMGGFGGGSGTGQFAGDPGFGGGKATAGNPGTGGSGAGMGGAIFNMQGQLTIVNSTLSGNTAVAGTAEDPSATGQGIAGAVFNLNGTFTATNSTVAGNQAADRASQIFNLGFDGHQARSAQTTLRNTIVSGGSPTIDLASDKPSSTNPATNLATADADLSQSNLVRTFAHQEGGTVSGTPLTSDPLLGTLKDNGGGIATMALGSGSPAIDATSGTAACPLSDERGVARPDPGETSCDLGAYETSPPAAGPAAATGVTTSSASLSGTVTPNSDDAAIHFDYGPTTAYGSQTPVQHLSGVSATQISASLSGLTPGTTYHFRLVGVNADGLAAGPDGTFTTAGGSTTGPPPSGALGIPAVTKLVVSPAAFAAAPRGPSARLARRLGKRRYGTTVTFSLSQAAGVRFTVSRQLPGRRSHGRCVAPTRKNHHAARCRRLRAVGGSFTRSGAAGTNRFRFLGRMGNRALRPGTYVLLATPVTGGQAGRSRSTSFRIVR